MAYGSGSCGLVPVLILMVFKGSFNEMKRTGFLRGFGTSLDYFVHMGIVNNHPK